jgi:hypothetical protein
MKRLTRTGAPEILIVGIALATAFVVMAPDPDARTLRSEDGRIEIQGPAQEQTVMTLVQEEDAQPHQVLLMPAYTLSVDGKPPSGAFAVHMNVPEADTIFTYDASVLAWRPLVLENRTSDGALEARTYAGAATYAAGKRPDLSPPGDRRTQVASMIASAPPGTIGFEASDARAWAEDEFIVVSDRFVVGGCGGDFRSGPVTTISTQENVLEDGSTYRLLVRWYAATGCAPGSPLMISP